MLLSGISRHKAYFFTCAVCDSDIWRFTNKRRPRQRWNRYLISYSCPSSNGAAM